MTTTNDLKIKLKKLTKKWFYLKEEVDTKIPQPASTTPLSDTNYGTQGDSTLYARADHVHSKSSLYATANHTHNAADINATSPISNGNIWTDSDSYMCVLNDELLYDFSVDKIYYKDPLDENCELATKGDIETIVEDIIRDEIGDAIDYINQ